jgi:hypothetical protein
LAAPIAKAVVIVGTKDAVSAWVAMTPPTVNRRTAMRTQQLLVALASLLVCGVASAQSTLPTVQVRADTRESVEVSCADPASIKPQDVERVLSIQQPVMTRRLRTKLIAVVTEACKAGIPHILVTRVAYDLTWKKMD